METERVVRVDGGETTRKKSLVRFVAGTIYIYSSGFVRFAHIRAYACKMYAQSYTATRCTVYASVVIYTRIYAIYRV